MGRQLAMTFYPKVSQVLLFRSRYSGISDHILRCITRNSLEILFCLLVKDGFYSRVVMLGTLSSGILILKYLNLLHRLYRLRRMRLITHKKGIEPFTDCHSLDAERKVSKILTRTRTTTRTTTTTTTKNCTITKNNTKRHTATQQIAKAATTTLMKAQFDITDVIAATTATIIMIIMITHRCNVFANNTSSNNIITRKQQH